MSSAGSRRRAPQVEEEEHENHERWMVSYADMVTLLMCLFIVMFAISSVDANKFAALKSGLQAGFGAPLALLSGGDALLDPGGGVAPDSVNLNGAASGEQNTVPIDPAQAVDPDSVAQLANAMARAAAADEVENLQKVRAALEKNLAAAGLRNGATFRFDERGLVVTIATDDVLFASGSAQLSEKGRSILKVLAPTLRRLPNRINVDGHTNSVPINTARYPSNWELSADRASSVLRVLIDRHGVDEHQISATAYADTRPLLPRSDPRATKRNRRVEIVVVAQVDDAAGRAFAAEADGAPLSPGDLDSASDSSAPH